ncbi:T-cell surface glycoprotein CD3 zeta chain isoform X2 [Engystomops pustulosus]|uniref:T-cell surface glycoprotein CD3 zeta chain isoform X2 n=1 Tax=Engystomops pustulosus TaxID=76066 RepID=UPI003AFA0428
MSKWIALSACLHTHLSIADAQFFGLNDPKYCYLLDGILFIYAIIVTALFFREKLVKRRPGHKDGNDDNYTDIKPGAQGGYGMNRGGDTEKGMNRMRSPDNSIYHGLQKDKMNDPYSDIRVKQQPRRKGKGQDVVYQGLSGAQRDTYDALQMQPLR